MKRIIATILMLICLCGPTAAVLAFGRQDVVTHTLASLVRVEFPVDGQDAPGVCTGFMVAPRRALTAAHCAPLDAGITVDGKTSIVISRSPEFALLLAGDKPALKLAKQVRLQEVVTSFGFAWGDMFVLQRRVAAFKDGDFATDGPLAPGMSGGPTVNQAGDVVGINQGANTVIGILCGAGEMMTFLATASPK